MKRQEQLWLQLNCCARLLSVSLVRCCRYGYFFAVQALGAGVGCGLWLVCGLPSRISMRWCGMALSWGLLLVGHVPAAFKAGVLQGRMRAAAPSCCLCAMLRQCMP